MEIDSEDKSWLTVHDLAHITGVAFEAICCLDSDYASNAMEVFEKAGLTATPYPAAFFMAQLRNLCPNRMVLDMIFHQSGISRDDLAEYNRFVCRGIEEDVDNLEDDNLPF